MPMVYPRSVQAKSHDRLGHTHRRWLSLRWGGEHAGLFSNDETLAKHILSSGEAVGELAWHMPLSKAYDKDIDSIVADVKNIGSGRGAGSITAAQFLQRFVNKTTWAHIDIAGTAWNKKDAPYPKQELLLSAFVCSIT